MAIQYGSTLAEVPSLEIILTNLGFKQYHKIAHDVERGYLMLEDLLDCTENDLHCLCEEYVISGVHERALIKAVKSFPDARANQPKESSQPVIHTIVLTAEEKRIWENLAAMRTAVEQGIAGIESVRRSKYDNTAAARAKIQAATAATHALLDELQASVMTALDRSESKQNENSDCAATLLKLNALEAYIKNLGAKYQTFVRSEESTNPKKQQIMTNAIDAAEMKVATVLDGLARFGAESVRICYDSQDVRPVFESIDTLFAAEGRNCNTAPEMSSEEWLAVDENAARESIGYYF